MSDVPDWLKDLSTDKQAQLKDWLDSELKSMSRRDMLKAIGAVGGGAAVGGAGVGALSQSARAADTGVAQVGAAGNPTDVVLDQIKDTGGDLVADLDDTGDMDWQGRGFNNLSSVATDEVSISGIPGQFVLNALAEGYVVAIHADESSSWLVDPSTDSNPINTAMDLVADAANGAGLPDEQRGAVYLPPRPISHANPVTPYNFVTVKTPLGVCEVQPAADTDGIVWDIANDPYNSYSFFRVDWSDARIKIQGQGNATSTAATGWVETTGHWRSHFGHIDINSWSVPSGDHLWHTESGASTFETTYEYVRLAGDAGNSDGMMQYDGGGALKRIGTIAAHTRTDVSGTVYPVVNSTSFGGTIDVMNLGGAGLGRAFQDTGPVHVRMINYEPGDAQPSAATSVFRINGSSTYARCDHVWLRSNATVDYVYQQYNGGRNYFGLVDDEGTVNSNMVLNQNDTNSTVIYEGPSPDVDESSGGTLTTPIACLGDLSTVT